MVIKKHRKRRNDTFMLLGGYIGSVAWRYSRRSILYQEEDLIQEAKIVLWKCLDRYPEKGDDEITKIFKTSFVRRLASLFRRVLVKTKSISLDQNPYLSEILVDRRFVTSWNFYHDNLKLMERELGRSFIRRMIDHKGRPSEKRIDRLKEVLMNRF